MELTSYIKKEVKKGFSISKIQKTLLEAGHSKKKIDEAVYEYSNTQDKKKHTLKMFVYAILIIMVVIGVVWSAVTLYTLPKQATNTPTIVEEGNHEDLSTPGPCGIVIGDPICLSLTNDNVEHCEGFSESIKTETLVQECKDMYYLISSMYIKNIAGCNNIIDDGTKIMCNNYINNNWDNCQSLNNDELRNTCLIFAKKDINECNKINNQDTRELCKIGTDYSKNGFSTNTCNLVENDLTKIRCQGLISKDNNICTIDTGACHTNIEDASFEIYG